MCWYQSILCLFVSRYTININSLDTVMPRHGTGKWVTVAWKAFCSVSCRGKVTGTPAVDLDFVCYRLYG